MGRRLPANLRRRGRRNQLARRPVEKCRAVVTTAQQRCLLGLSRKCPVAALRTREGAHSRGRTVVAQGPMGGRAAVFRLSAEGAIFSRPLRANHERKHDQTTLPRPGTVAVPPSATATACWPADAVAAAAAPAAAAPPPRPAASLRVSHRTRGCSCARASCSWTRGEASASIQPHNRANPHSPFPALPSPVQPLAAALRLPCGCLAAA